jgi:D-alanyl-D-alanine dipeptidase
MIIDINECGEPLIEITKYCPNIVNNLEPARLKKESTLYLRLTVAKMLARANSFLPDGIVFVVNDAWRPLLVQSRYFNFYLNKYKKMFPNWNDKKLYAYTAKYVVPPNDRRRAGHLTGAAIDLELMKNNRRLPMKSLGLEHSERSETMFKQLQNHINRNRQLLYDVMTKAGFINYPKEYWHYSYGDVMWAELTGSTTAIYGIKTLD